MQTVTGWSQLCPSLASSGVKYWVIAPSLPSSGRREGWCAAWYQQPGWLHGANVSPYPGVAQLSWGQLLQLILSSLEEQGGCLAASTLPLSEQKPQKSWQCFTPGYPYLLPSISATVTHKGIGGLMLPYWTIPYWMLPTSDHCFPWLQNQASALRSLSWEVSKERSWGHQCIELHISINLCQTLTCVDLAGDLERGQDPVILSGVGNWLSE